MRSICDLLKAITRHENAGLMLSRKPFVAGGLLITKSKYNINRLYVCISPSSLENGVVPEACLGTWVHGVNMTFREWRF